MRAMVLCAGYGTRLGNLTAEMPKPMLLLQGRPLLEYIVVNLARHGFREIAVNLHFLPERIREYFGDGSRLGVRMQYSFEPALMGTAGGLKAMEGFLGLDDCFLAHYGDILTDQAFGQMVEFHRARSAVMTMLVHERKSSNSVVDMDGERRVVGFLERPTEDERLESTSSWVNSGISICSREVLAAIPSNGASDIPRDILPKLIPSGRVFGYPLSGYRCAIDSAERLAEAREAVTGSSAFQATGRDA